MVIKVQRLVFTETATLGKMYIDNVFFAHTLEDTYRALHGDISKKVAGKTCIDNGTYSLIVSMSNRFKRMLPLIQHVPCFEGVRIHGGNTAEDTEGCILVGEQTNGVDKIWNCAGKMRDLMARLEGQTDVKIIIEGEPPAVIV